MSNLRRRLRKLEARLTDSSGIIPNSQEWLDHWLPKVDRIVSGEGGDSSERTFVLRVAHNRGITFSIRRRRFQGLPEDGQLPDPAPLAEQRLIEEQRRDRLFQGIRRLPKAQRQAVMLRLEGLSQREIAELQDTSETNVGARLTRARRSLRTLLGEEEP